MVILGDEDNNDDFLNKIAIKYNERIYHPWTMRAYRSSK